MKAILYCRKSSESEDRQVMSLDAQEKELRKVAQRDGIEIVETYRESMSAKAPSRPLFGEMVKEVAKGKIDGILCWKLDRLARNPIDAGTISWMLQTNQIKFIQTHDRTYLPTDNVLLMYVELGMSNQYVRDLSENVKRGNREKLRRGEWPNHAPYGYRNDKNTKTLKVIPSQAKVVKGLFEDYASGHYSFSDLRKKYDLPKSTIERIIKKTFYYGLMERDGKFYKGIHTPIISKELYERSQEVKKQVTVHRPRQEKLFFTYRGLMRCAVCGCQMTATRKKGMYDYYYCTNGKGACDQHKEYLNESKANEFFEKALENIKFDEELVDIMYEASLEKLQNSQDDNEQAFNDIKNQLENLKRQERKLLQSFTSELIAEELYKEEVARIQKQKENLESEMQNYSQDTNTRLNTLELTKSVFLEGNKAISEFRNAEPEQKHKIAQNLLWNLEVKDKNVLSYKYKSPYNIIANAPKNGDLQTMLPD